MAGLTELVEALECRAPVLLTAESPIEIGQAVVGRYVKGVEADGRLEILDRCVRLVELGADLSHVVAHVGIIGVGGGDLLQRGQRLVVFLALGVVDQAEGVVGVEEVGVGSESGYQGGGGTVVFAERVVGDAEIGVGTGVAGGNGQGRSE